jgi:hypothetical protein
MTMFIAAHGRLGADPRPITTKTGKPMCFGSIAVELPGRNT